jgi:hypothetical protein
LHQRAVAQMQMPVVGAGKGELLHDVFRLDNGRDCNSKSSPVRFVTGRRKQFDSDIFGLRGLAGDR